MKRMFSKRAREAKASEVRELLKLTDNNDIIAFGGGLPAQEAFPVEEMIEVCKDILVAHGTKAMQYATTEGNNEIRGLMQEIMKEKGITAEIENILVTSGSQQGLDLTAKVFIEEGDKVICEKPTYMAAINAFKPFSPQFLEVEMEEDGITLEDLEALLQQNPDAKFIYTIPDFQNPTGRSMSLGKRKKLVHIANKYDILIIEDNPYSELRFSGETSPPIKSFDTEGRVIYLSTFSKIVCPGFRIGWVCGEKEIINKYGLLKQGTDLHTNIFSQLQILYFFKTYDIKQRINKVREIYKKKRDVMIETIEKEFPKEVEFTRPMGGMFVWVTLPEDMEAKKLLEKAITQGVAFVPGEAFYASSEVKNTLRLNFSGLEEDKIQIGIRRLAEVIKNEM
ncbi:PLP-dependent aminotransferase family protein [Clostridium formicaceticum]|uniref:2-aminoadipate transaminase n=1 Tax=Clostridium formicaceticum TaxID=1497 RepID=A0AAC9RLU1_9CLOT|nr:PLP-dependent aminotransferase family protein [Clostridium formicaceticum]AOY78462.1 aminotransferase [Clostridium formicaceticum]ARE88391.1 2-aminoadipate transaminase [Clostridium formicaceticum]